MFVDIELG